MSLNLVEFLRARLDEDEALARKASEYAEASWKLDEEFGETVLWWPPEPRVAEQERKHGLPVVSDQWRGQTIDSRIAPHIARHDPARVLAEVESDRALLKEYEESEAALGSAPDMWDVGRVEGLRVAVAMRAARYAGHEDYHESWRP